MKKKLIVLTLCGILALTILPIKSNAEIKANQVKEIEITDNYVDMLEKYSDYPEEISNYLYSLSSNELIKAIREVSEYLEENSADTNMMVFVPVAKDNLMKILKDEDYIKIINDDNNSDLMRMFFMDMYNNSVDASSIYNDTLRNIINDGDESYKIRTYSLNSITNIGKEDIPMLKKILDSSIKSEEFKAFALQNYTEIAPEEALELNMDILDNYENYSDREVVTAMRSIYKVYYKNTLEDKEKLGSKTISNTKINNFDLDKSLEKIDNILSETDKTLLKDGATFTLSDMKNEKALEIVIKNRESIDDYIIKDVIDQNFNTVESIIKSGENIELALECMDIMPMKEFSELLNIVEANYSNSNMYMKNTDSNSIEDLKEKIEESNYSHNIKWDNN